MIYSPKPYKKTVLLPQRHHIWIYYHARDTLKIDFSMKVLVEKRNKKLIDIYLFILSPQSNIITQTHQQEPMKPPRRSNTYHPIKQIKIIDIMQAKYR